MMDHLPTRFPSSHLTRKVSLLCCSALLSLSLAACQTDSITTAGINKSSAQSAQTTGGHQDNLKAVAYWDTKYRKTPDDRTTALQFSRVLRESGRTEQAVAVLQKASFQHTEDAELKAAYGKALAAFGRLQDALKVLQEAQRSDQPDWRLISAEATVHDQLGNRTKARKLYEKALRDAPNNPTILTNLGMSHVLEGDLATAERLLKQAVSAGPRPDGRIRQNLALVVGLQGRFDEAERIAKSDLPPQQAAENIKFLRSMLTQQNTWDDIKKADG